MPRKPDFTGWATRYNVRCSDGLTIMNGAFAHNDGIKVPLVFQHNHSDQGNVLGHALITHMSEGVRAAGFFDNTSQGQNGKEMVHSGTLDSLSVFARNVKKNGQNVVHADLVEISLVLKGANPEAKIDEVFIEHGDGEYSEAGEIIISHALGLDSPEESSSEDDEKTLEHADDSDKSEDDEKTVGEVFDEMTDVQKDAVYAMLAAAVAAKNEADDENKDEDDKKKEDSVGHNVFENKDEGDTLAQSELKIEEARAAVLEGMKATGSFQSSVIAHAFEYGIKDPEVLFPDAKLTGGVTGIRRSQEWVGKLVNGATHLPFSRFKSRYSDLTKEEIRARGYVTAARKLDTVYEILGRETGPTTVYIKTKMDRDTILDITDMDIVAWAREQLRVDMNEELARAFLIGDGRDSGSPDKIKADRIRPVISDDDLYSMKFALSTDAQNIATNKDLILEEITYALEDYQGSNPIMFATRHAINRLTWMRDNQGRRLYSGRSEVADALGIAGFAEVPFLKNTKVTLEGGEKNVFCVLLNPADYHTGTDNGGSLTWFENFDIDYNQQKFLLETRLSGALRDPGTAVVITGSIGTAAGPAKDPKKASDPQMPAVN